jgi:hypothetical protein
VDPDDSHYDITAGAGFCEPRVANTPAVIWTTLFVAKEMFRYLDPPELGADIAAGVTYVNALRVTPSPAMAAEKPPPETHVH